LSELLAIWGFVDEHTFLTKAGALGLVYRVRGVDYECLDHADRRVVVQRFEQALRQLDESFRVMQYLLKRATAPFASEPHPHPVVEEALGRRVDYLNQKRERLYDLELYLVVLRENAVRRQSGGTLAGLLTDTSRTLRNAFSSTSVTTMLDSELGD